MKFIMSNPTERLGRTAAIASAQCLGGGPSVNFVIYNLNRAPASDFNDWETQYNNPGWSYKDLIPLMRKAETYQPDPEANAHNSSGPLKASWSGCFTNIAQDFLEVAAKYDK
ncbi:hypothetical protein EUX98_g6078 [Antrodiella citrinella]|uniref:Glucose-methanol-choline oxidoreductase N-terminal domain-containing protein n=1 Tax=Antrodiella citrinella TaxID=2447956 RepID=A0A4S4MSI5_9APHY|nr:hypothetical protein EUX98_g6078 [Antrodiella citrinella]